MNKIYPTVVSRDNRTQYTIAILLFSFIQLCPHYVVGANGLVSRYMPTDRPYVYRTANIRMSRMNHPPSTSVQSDHHPAPVSSSSNIWRNLSTNGVNFNVGGFGLTSSSPQNRISLGSLTNPLRGGAKNSLITNNEANIPKPTNPSWPDKRFTSSGETTNVNMRVMGQPIDLNVVNKLHPDVSPYKARKLRKILAGSLDHKWTSEVVPRVLRIRGVSGALTSDEDSKTIDTRLVKEANQLNFTLRYGVGKYFNLAADNIQPFRDWLVDKATCEMDYIWEDLGPLFWPRWIRRGVCINPPGHSCSWPSGMKCRPSGSRALQLLHWKCEDAAYIQSREEAAEQRNRRRTVSNTFKSNFYDMTPVNSVSMPSKSGNRIGRTVVSRMDVSQPTISLSANTRPIIRLHRRSTNWPTLTLSKLPNEPKRVEETMSKDERRRRRAKRLIKRLSVTADGYHCYWQIQKYLISDRCACMCS